MPTWPILTRQSPVPLCCGAIDIRLTGSACAVGYLDTPAAISRMPAAVGCPPHSVRPFAVIAVNRTRQGARGSQRARPAGDQAHHNAWQHCSMDPLARLSQRFQPPGPGQRATLCKSCPGFSDPALTDARDLLDLLDLRDQCSAPAPTAAWHRVGRGGFTMKP
jgi:hypothetical protein